MSVELGDIMNIWTSRKSSLAIGITIFCLLLPLSLEVAASERVTAVGTAEIVDGDELKSRARALRVAREEAAIRAIEATLGEATVIDNFTIIESSLAPYVNDLINVDSVLDESTDGTLYRVRVACSYDSDLIMEQAIELGLLKDAGRQYKPRIIVVIPEQDRGRYTPHPSAETSIVGELARQHFYVVDQQRVDEIRYTDQALAAARGDVAAAEAIGRKFGAEVIITGEASSQEVKSAVAGTVSCRASVQARAVKTDTGQIIGAEDSHQSAIEATRELASRECLRLAGKDVAHSLMLQVLDWEGADEELGRRITVYIPKVSYDRLEKIKKLLSEDIPQVEEFLQRSYTERTAELEVVFKGSSQELADLLQGFNLPGGWLRVSNYSENRIDCVIKYYESDDPRLSR